MPGLRRVFATGLHPSDKGAIIDNRTTHVGKGALMSDHSLPRRTFTRRHRFTSGLAAMAIVGSLASSTVAAAPTPANADSAGWTVATPESQGMDSATLQGTCDYAMQPERHTQGVVVIRGGKLVDECYAKGEGPRSWAASWSVAKSYASTLIGIAIDQAKIPSLDVSMADYFPAWKGTPKAQITLKDVVTMSSGLKWNEDYAPADGGDSDVIQMGVAKDQLAYAASRPLAHTPGTVWNYSSGDAMLLSGVIAKATGMSAGEYAQKVLFGPLGMKQVEWWTDAKGHTLTYCCNDTTSRDYARLGQLFLNNGNWNGTQIVSASWVHDAFQPVPASNGIYGYMWWISHVPGTNDPIYSADGFDNQYIMIIPSLDMVIVRNSDYVKSACEPIADPNLFSRYPPLNLIPGQGTRPPESWDDAAFVKPAADSVTAPLEGADVFPAPETQPETRFPDGQATAPCAATTPTTTPNGGSTTTSMPSATQGAIAATPVSATPAYTG